MSRLELRRLHATIRPEQPSERLFRAAMVLLPGNHVLLDAGWHAGRCAIVNQIAAATAKSNLYCSDAVAAQDGKEGEEGSWSSSTHWKEGQPF